MWSIKYDNTELCNSTYNVSRVLDDTTAPRELNITETEGVSGAVIINDRWGSKTIRIKGILVGTSPSDLQTKIDTLNELFARTAKNLDILPTGGSTRRYVARLIGSVEYDRDFYNDDYVPFTANFFVKSGVGKDTSETTAYEELNTAVERQPAASSDDMSLVGSANPKPKIEVTLDTIGKLDLLTFTNDDDSKEMSVEIDSDYFNNADKIIIDTADQTVKKERSGVQSEIAFSGEIPDFSLGTNNFHFDFQGATLTLDQEQITAHNNGLVVGTTAGGTKYCQAQKFVPSRSGYLSKLKIWAEKTGNPGTFYVDIYQDNGDLPATIFGTAFATANAVFDTSSAEINLTIYDLKYLRKGTTYWLVFRTSDSAGNFYMIFGSGSATEDYYENGEWLKYDGGIIPPTDPSDWLIAPLEAEPGDIYFKTYQGQGGAVNWFVDLVVKYTKRYL